MAFVVFLRGVNVGGAKSFKPTALAADLADLEVESVGAAGTFLVRGKGTAKGVAKRFREALPFEADVYARPAQEVLDLLARDPFRGRLPPDARPFVTILAETPAGPPPALPIDRPEGAAWEVRLVAVEGAYALCARRVAGGKHYPNEIVEKVLGVRATTRAWSTLGTVAKRLGPV